MYTQALKYLNEEMMANIAMIEAIHRDNAEILSAERGAVLLREKNSGAYMLYAKEFEPGEVLLRLLLRYIPPDHVYENNNYPDKNTGKLQV